MLSSYNNGTLLTKKFSLPNITINNTKFNKTNPEVFELLKNKNNSLTNLKLQNQKQTVFSKTSSNFLPNKINKKNGINVINC